MPKDTMLKIECPDCHNTTTTWQNLSVGTLFIERCNTCGSQFVGEIAIISISTDTYSLKESFTKITIKENDKNA